MADLSLATPPKREKRRIQVRVRPARERRYFLHHLFLKLVAEFVVLEERVDDEGEFVGKGDRLVDLFQPVDRLVGDGKEHIRLLTDR